VRHAAENGFILLTQDLDFGAILAASQAHKPSVVQIRADNTNPDHVGADIIKALRQAASELEQGALVTRRAWPQTDDTASLPRILMQTSLGQ
jgi:predicted nuclease of predicted toxin-antitoxin system